MGAYATVDDLAARYPNLAADARAEVLLDDATAAIDMAFTSRGRTVPAEAGDALLLKEARRVCCQLVARELTSDDPTDVTQLTVSAGPFSRTASLGAGRNLRLNAADLAALGLGSGAGWTDGGDPGC